MNPGCTAVVTLFGQRFGHGVAWPVLLQGGMATGLAG